MWSMGSSQYGCLLLHSQKKNPKESTKAKSYKTKHNHTDDTPSFLPYSTLGQGTEEGTYTRQCRFGGHIWICLPQKPFFTRKCKGFSSASKR